VERSRVLGLPALLPREVGAAVVPSPGNTHLERLKLWLSASARKSQKTVSRHAEVQISGRFGSNPAVFSQQRT
jgi:hypothetical protein